MKDIPLKDRLVFACDKSAAKRVGGGLSEAEALVREMAGKVGWIKINSAFVGGGHDLVKRIVDSGSKLWLDLKFHDVVDTLENYVSEIKEAFPGMTMFNVHASGTSKMMKAVRKKVDELFPVGSPDRLIAIAITVLTSIGEEEFKELGYDCTIEEHVMRLARLTQKSGLDGVVSSALEVKSLRQEFGPDFMLVTPGMRFAEEAKGNQARVTTPKESILNGADIVVMGTSLIKGGLKAVDRAYAEIEEGLALREAA